eukprot:1986679-Prymnesium_polylepis.1
MRTGLVRGCLLAAQPAADCVPRVHRMQLSFSYSSRQAGPPKNKAASRGVPGCDRGYLQHELTQGVGLTARDPRSLSPQKH